MRNLCCFELWDFERDGRCYERLGIRWFKRFAIQGDFWNKVRRRSDPGFRNVKDLDSALEWEARTRTNELRHLCTLAIGLAIMAWLYSRSEYAWLAVVFFAVLVWDIYPIMLQRYNRARIQRVKSRPRRTLAKPTGCKDRTSGT
jgi:hypothetical protein